MVGRRAQIGYGRPVYEVPALVLQGSAAAGSAGGVGSVGGRRRAVPQDEVAVASGEVDEADLEVVEVRECCAAAWPVAVVDGKVRPAAGSAVDDDLRVFWVNVDVGARLGGRWR